MTTTQRPLPPGSIRWGSIIAILQSLVGFGYAGILVYREILGAEDPSLVSEGDNASWVGYGTAIFFAIIFGTVLAGAVSMMRGRRWGRGPVAMLQIILLPISYYMFTGGAILFGVITLVSAVLGLIMLFQPQSVAWAASSYKR